MTISRLKLTKKLIGTFEQTLYPRVDIWEANKPMKRCSTGLVTRKTDNETTLHTTKITLMSFLDRNKYC